MSLLMTSEPHAIVDTLDKTALNSLLSLARDVLGGTDVQCFKRLVDAGVLSASHYSLVGLRGWNVF